MTTLAPTAETIVAPVKPAKFVAPAQVEKPIGKIAFDAAQILQHAKDEQKRYKAIEVEQSAIVREALGDANVGTFMGVRVVKLAYRAPTKLNEKLVKEVFPEAFELCSYVCEYNFIEVL